MLAVAGVAGETVYLGETVGLRGSDLKHASFWAHALVESDKVAQMIIDAAQTEAEQMILRVTNEFSRA